MLCLIKLNTVAAQKIDKCRATFSRNSITHDPIARNQLDANEQSLNDETVKNLIVDFDPKTSIEKILIFKLAEYTVRLIRIQQVENVMFDLASSEAEHIVEAIKILVNDYKSDSRLIDSIDTGRLGYPTYNPNIAIDKINIMDEIYFQNLSDVSGENYAQRWWEIRNQCMRYLQSWNDSNWLIIN